MIEPTAESAGQYESLRFLLKAGEALSESLDYEETLSRLAWQAVPAIADWCAVDLLDGGGKLRRLAVAHSDPAKLDYVRELQERFPEDPSSPTGSYARLRKGEVEWLAEIPDELLVAAARNDEHLNAIRRLGLKSFVSVPLIANGVRLGLLSLVYAESGRRYSEQDAKVAAELGRRAALAIQQAKSYRDLQESSKQLQEQAVQLEMQSQQLQDQATELEAQQVELEQANDELMARNEQLQASEQFARGIIDAIAEPMVVYDREWRLQYENAAAARVFRSGPGQASMVGKVVWEEYPDLVGSGFEREMRRVAETRQPASFVERREATNRWVEVRCYPLPTGGITAVWRDITSQKRGEEAMYYLSRASEILGASLNYEETLEALANLVVPELADWCTVSLVDDGVIRQVAVAHQDPSKVEWAKELSQRYPPNPNASTGVAQVVRSGKPEFFPEITDHMLETAIKDPEYLDALRRVGFTSVITVPLQARGRSFGALSLVTAESRRRYAEEDLRLAVELGRRAGAAVDNARLYAEAVEARRAAEEANATKTTFLATMSHELRTPLNAIGGFAELLATGVRGEMTPDQLKDLERIQRSQRHLLSLINEVLNYAKVEGGRVSYEMSDVPVADALADLESLFAPQMQERRVTYELARVKKSLVVRADPEKLQQILLNLMSNAVKFSPEGGRILVSAESAGDAVLIHVRDQGRGIPEEKREAIFEPFVQLRFAGAVNEGTGLGLAISRDLARGMQGDLTVESEEQGGSTFTLRLPKA